MEAITILVVIFLIKLIQEIKKKNIYVTLPISKLVFIQILALIHFSLYLMAANISYDSGGLKAFHFFLGLINASFFFLSDMFFFHIGLGWKFRWLRNGFQMTFQIILLLNLFLIYLYSYIGFSVLIIRQISLIFFAGYIGI